jgi:hypothetical protein
METNDLFNDISPEAMESLRLPAPLDEVTRQTMLDIDSILEQDETITVGTLDDKLAIHREVSLAHLLTIHRKLPIELEWFTWPSYLYIPKDANAREYWFTQAPDDHRYCIDWTSPTNATANRASRLDGTLSSFSQLDNANAGRPQSSESGVGICYKPSMTLGVIDFQPHVDCSGTLRTFLEYFPQLSAGYVEVRAHLLLAAWHQIPGGFDLVGWKQFDVATSGRIDQTHGAKEHFFQSSFAGPSLSAPFVVQSGRTYLLGVVSRISIISSLTSNTGGVLPPISNQLLRVWGTLNCVVPQIDVLTKRIDIP